MKILRIENNTACYLDSACNWKSIDNLNKDDLLHLLQSAYDNKIEMDSYESYTISNEAHRIIYTHIYNVIHDFGSTKNEIESMINKEFQEAFEKYSNSPSA